jgi:hypothetical protein
MHAEERERLPPREELHALDAEEVRVDLHGLRRCDGERAPREAERAARLDVDVEEPLVAAAVRRDLVADLGLVSGGDVEGHLLDGRREDRRVVVAEEEARGPRAEVARGEADGVLGTEREPRVHVALDREVACAGRTDEVDEDEGEEDGIEESYDEIDPRDERGEEEHSRRPREEDHGPSRRQEGGGLQARRSSHTRTWASKSRNWAGAMRKIHRHNHDLTRSMIRCVI